MSYFWPFMCLILFVLLLIADFVYGAFVFVFPAMFLLFLFVSFGLIILDAEDQERANPGLEQLQEPDIWSRIYNAWLYVNDEEAWTRYAFFFSVLGAVIVGSIAGLVVLPLLNAPSDAFTAVLTGWVLGNPLTASTGMLVAKSYPWL